MKFLVYEGSKPLVNNVAQGSIQDVLSLSIGFQVFPKLEIFKILCFLLFGKTLVVKVLVLNNLDYKVFCQVIASFNYQVKLLGQKIGIFVFLMT